MPLGVSLDALKVLEAIHTQGTFAGAAKALFKVPSALTYTIAKMESELGVALFDRSGQRAVLTPAGQLLLDEGRELLAAATRLQEKVKQLDTGWEPELALALDTIMPKEPLFNILQRYCGLGKQSVITIQEEALGGGWDALYTGRADIAIGLSGELPKGLYDIATIGNISFVFAISPQHPLSQQSGVISSQQLGDYAAVIVADSSRSLPQRSTGLTHCKQVIRVTSMEDKLQAQLKGLGIGFLPSFLASPYIERGELVVKQVDFPRPEIEVYVARLKQQAGQGSDWLYEQIKQAEWAIY